MAQVAIDTRWDGIAGIQRYSREVLPRLTTRGSRSGSTVTTSPRWMRCALCRAIASSTRPATTPSCGRSGSS
ncbi:hypothetical protein ACFONK_00010 [Microbacterium barkeri]|uniref:hypothetical protein n=1 Tax=Microbacterium barkeri TaxID=33917 RepID=UPI00360ECECD